MSLSLNSIARDLIISSASETIDKSVTPEEVKYSNINIEKLIKASFTLLYMIIDSDNDKEKFKKYVEKKLEAKENKIDKYYVNIGENAYIKNYIGFKNLNNINIFMNFDYNIYKDKYPTKYDSLLAQIIAFTVPFFFYFLFLYVRIFRNEYKNYINKREKEEVKKNKTEKKK